MNATGSSRGDRKGESKSRGAGDSNDSAQLDQVGLADIVAELRMLRSEMEQYYSMIFKAQVEMLTSWGDFFALWMETVKHNNL